MRWTFGAALLAIAASASADPPKPPTMIGNGMGEVSFLRFSPDGRELVRICQFGGVELLDTDGYDKVLMFAGGMRMISFNPDGTRIASAEGTDGARVWDATLRGKKIPKSPEIPWSEVSVMETPLKVLEAPSSSGSGSVDTKRDKQRVFRAEFSPDGKRIVTTHANGHAKVWSADTWALEADLALGESELRAAAFAPDRKSAVFGDVDGVLHEWNFERKVDVKTTSTKGAVRDIVFAPDGSALMTVHQAKSGPSVVFWDKARKILETKDGWSSVSVSKDGRTMALGGARVEFIDPSTRKTIRTVELPTITMGESNPMFAQDPNARLKVPMVVVALAFSPDGATLAAGCQDGTIRLIKTAP